MYSYGFEKLEVWQLSRKFVVKVYKLTKNFPQSEKFGIVMQVRKSSVSVCSNIAEGTGRQTSRDRAHFYTQAFTSLMEALSQLIVSCDLEWLTQSELTEIRLDIDLIAQKLSRLRSSEQNVR